MNDKSLQMKDEFDSWRAYGQSAPAANAPNASADAYLQSYYSAAPTIQSAMALPYDHTWSVNAAPNGQTSAHDAFAYHSDHASGASGQSYAAVDAFHSSQQWSAATAASFSSPFNAFFDPFWGNKRHQPTPAYGRDHHDYYTAAAVAAAEPHYELKSVDQSLSALSLDHVIKPSTTGAFADKKFEVVGGGAGVGHTPVGPKKTTWASIASQPAKPQPKSLKSKMTSAVLQKHVPPPPEPIGTWSEAKANGAPATPPVAPRPSWPTSSARPPARQESALPAAVGHGAPASAMASMGGSALAASSAVHPVLDKLRVENNYNPREFELNPRAARFFIIKSYSEDDIHRSIKYSIWCSTEHGNKRLDGAWRQQQDKGPIFLLFSVNGSGHFCGMAQMMSSVDYSSSSSVWAQDKWKGQFRVRWIYVKDVPNAQLRHIRLENNENKPVTNSRDTQEVPLEKGKQVVKIMHHYRHTTSIFDDFLHYEKRQEEESARREDPAPTAAPAQASPAAAAAAVGRRAQQWGKGSTVQ